MRGNRRGHFVLIVKCDHRLFVPADQFPRNRAPHESRQAPQDGSEDQRFGHGSSLRVAEVVPGGTCPTCWATESTLPSGSLNHATLSPPGAVQMPSS